MDLRNHINLIKNYGYKGTVAILHHDAGASHKKGDIVMVQEDPPSMMDCPEFSEYLKRNKTIERPLSEQEIIKRKSEGSGQITIGTCINVPADYLEEIVI